MNPRADAATMNRERLRIVIADDHPIVRSGLRLRLEVEPGWTVVGETGDIAATVRAVNSLRPDVLLLDLHMPGGSTLAALPALRRQIPATVVAVLTMDDDPILAREAVRAGASAYVLKEETDQDLVDAVRAAMAGRSYLNPRLGGAIAALGTSPARSRET